MAIRSLTVAKQQEQQTQLQRAQDRVKRLLSKGNEKAAQTTSAIFTLGGGALHGYLASLDKTIFGMRSEIAAGAALAVAGYLGLGGKQSSNIFEAGMGCLASSVSVTVRGYQREKALKAAAKE